VAAASFISVPNVNSPKDTFGNAAIGYVDISAKIDVTSSVGFGTKQGNQTITEESCTASMGAFRPAVDEHLNTAPTGTISYYSLPKLTAFSTCKIAIALTARDSRGVTIGSQMSSWQDAAGGALVVNLQWGHLFCFRQGLHILSFEMHLQLKGVDQGVIQSQDFAYILDGQNG
jgi:hypothetical protein